MSRRARIELTLELIRALLTGMAGYILLYVSMSRLQFFARIDAERWDLTLDLALGFSAALAVFGIYRALRLRKHSA